MAYQPELLQTAPVIDPTQLETIDVYGKLEVVKEQAEFLATSHGEVNKAMSLLDDMQKPWGAAIHIREVGQHQAKYEHAREPAQIAVVREFASYAGRARVDRTNLGTLKEEVADLSSGHPFQYLPENRFVSGRGALVRYIDLSRLAREKDPLAFPFPPLRGYTPGSQDAYDLYTVNNPQPVVATHIAEVLSKIRRYDAEDLVRDAHEDQVNRFTFWSARLQEVARHQMGAAGAAAKRELGRLGVKEA